MWRISFTVTLNVTYNVTITDKWRLKWRLNKNVKIVTVPLTRYYLATVNGNKSNGPCDGRIFR